MLTKNPFDVAFCIVLALQGAKSGTIQCYTKEFVMQKCNHPVMSGIGLCGVKYDWALYQKLIWMCVLVVVLAVCRGHQHNVNSKCINLCKVHRSCAKLNSTLLCIRMPYSIIRGVQKTIKLMMEHKFQVGKEHFLIEFFLK